MVAQYLMNTFWNEREKLIENVGLSKFEMIIETGNVEREIFHFECNRVVDC